MAVKIDPFAKEIIIKIITYLVIAAVVYFMIIRPVLIKFGIIKSAEDKKRDEVAKTFGTSTESPFSPTYYKRVKNAVIFTRATGERIADQLYDAIGSIWGDDENAIYSALRQLKTKSQLSYVSELVTLRHKADLYTLLRRNLSDSEMDIVNGIANNLESK